MPITKGELSNIEVVQWTRVSHQIGELADSLDALLTTIQVSFERNNTNLGLVKIGQRGLHELRCVAEQTEGHIEELAWRVRNLHEIDLTLRYVLQRDEHLTEWTGQMLTDEKDIIEGFLRLASHYTKDQRLTLEKRLQGIDEAASHLGLQMRRPWSMRQLAKATSRESEYEIFYKFFSKFVHPSSWIVNGRADRTDDDTYRNLILGLAQVLARRIYGMLFDHYQLNEVTGRESNPSKPWERQ